VISLTRDVGLHLVPARFVGAGAVKNALLLATAYYDAQLGDRFPLESGLWKSAKPALRQDSRGKCAYCEAPTDIVAHGDVEHFRPKSIYWWLALCYQNYLFSCQICNQVHKKDQFPVRGIRMAPPSMPKQRPGNDELGAVAEELAIDAVAPLSHDVLASWSGEGAGLISPYIEDPEEFLAYETDDLNREIWVVAVEGDGASRAADTIDVLGLNREELRRARYSLYLPLAVLKVVLLATVSDDLRNVALAEFLRLQDGSEPFSGMRRYFARTWGLPGPEI